MICIKAEAHFFDVIAKHEVGQYSLSLPFAFVANVWIGWYTTNFISYMPPRLADDGKTVDFAYPIYSGTCTCKHIFYCPLVRSAQHVHVVPIVNAEVDTGPAILSLLLPSGDFCNRRAFWIASEMLSLADIARQYQEGACSCTTNFANLSRNIGQQSPGSLLDM